MHIERRQNIEMVNVSYINSQLRSSTDALVSSSNVFLKLMTG